MRDNRSSSLRTDRRTFLQLGVAGAGLWALRDLEALSKLPADARRVLVVLQLSGGNDGLNTLVPIDDPAYGKARRALGLDRNSVHRIGDGRALHPALKAAAELTARGRIAWIQGIGYPNPNRSHFKSMDIWHAADPSGRDLRFGWLGRALDELAGRRPRADLAVNLAQKPPLALNGRRVKPISFTNPALYRFTGPDDEGRLFADVVKAESSGGGILSELRRTAREAVETSAEIRRAALGYRTPVSYPRGPLGNALKTIAALLAAGLPTRVYYAYHNGFDTHVNQMGRHSQLLARLDEALAAFQKDLERLGVADRVALFGFSEFGRRVRENRSNGTDHGCASVAFLMGTRVRGGLHGRYPSLEDLDHGDLRFTTDFRDVYAALLGGWLGVDPARVLGPGRRPPALFA